MGFFSLNTTTEKTIKPIWFGIVFIPLFVVFLFLQFQQKKPIEGIVQVAATDIYVALAQTPEEHAKGLSGVEYLPNGEGMLFLFDKEGYHRIWMRGMVIPIDIVWLRHGRIVDIALEIDPPQFPDMPVEDLRVYTPQEPADMILEVAAGFAGAQGWEIGDEMIVR